MEEILYKQSKDEDHHLQPKLVQPRKYLLRHLLFTRNRSKISIMKPGNNNSEKNSMLPFLFKQCGTANIQGVGGNLVTAPKRTWWKKI